MFRLKIKERIKASIIVSLLGAGIPLPSAAAGLSLLIQDASRCLE